MTGNPEHMRVAAWLRRPGRTRFFGGLAVAFAVLFFVIPLLGHHGGFAGIAAFCWCIAVLALLFARRLWRAGVWIAADGVVVRNPLRTVMVPLDDADEFIAGVASGAGNGTPCPMLRRRQGRPVGVWALGREGVIWRFRRYTEEMKPVCDELNAVLDGLRPYLGLDCSGPAT